MSTSTVGTVTSTGYLYDKSGMRLTQGDTSSTMLYVSPAYNATLNSIGTVIDTEKHVGDGVRTYATIDGTGIPARVLFSHPDHLSGGSVITNSLNQVEQFLDYTPYGSVYLDQKIGSWSEQRQFTGHEYDPGTRYNYMKARYYEPGVKRFLSVDPVFLDLSFKIEDPQSMNSYAYARNSPIYQVDPDGRDAVLNLGMLAGIQLGKLTAPYVINDPVQALQTGSRFLPYYGDAVDVYEAVAGKDVYSGESLSGVERAVTGGLVAAPIVPGAVGRAGVKAVSEVSKIGSDLSSVAAKAVKDLNSYSVYQGFDAEGAVRYVGITSRNPFERFTEHLRSLGSGRESLRYSPIDGADNLTRDKARSIEQGVINQYGLQKEGGQLLNKINSIAPRSKSW